MQFVIVLVAAYALTWLVPPRTRWDQRNRWRTALGLAMVFAGVSHLLMPAPFLQHVPPWIPAAEAVVLLSGLAEVALGLAVLLAPRLWRPLVGLALALFLVAVFPGNIYVAVAGIDVEGLPGGVYPWLRLLLQPVFVWLAVWTTRAAPPRSRPTTTTAIRPAAAAKATPVSSGR